MSTSEKGRGANGTIAEAPLGATSTKTQPNTPSDTEEHPKISLKKAVAGMVLAALGTAGATYALMNGEKDDNRPEPAHVTPAKPDKEAPEQTQEEKRGYFSLLLAGYFQKDLYDQTKEAISSERKKGIRMMLIKTFPELQKTFPEITADNFELNPSEPNAPSAVTKDKKLNCTFAGDQTDGGEAQKINFVLDLINGKVELKKPAKPGVAVVPSASPATPKNDQEFDNMKPSEISAEIERLDSELNGNGRGRILYPGGDDRSQAERDAGEKRRQEEERKNAAKKARLAALKKYADEHGIRY